MTLKGILTVLLGLLWLTSAVWSQDTSTGDVKVTSDPQGAMVTMEGDVTVSGVTPVRFHHLLMGDYKLTFRKNGYEDYKTWLAFDPSKQIEVDIRMSPKTRFKAAMRSLFIPGWGQRYSDRKGRGFLFTTFAVGAAATFAIAEFGYRDKKDEYDELVARYDSTAANGTIEELRQLQPALNAARSEAYDAETFRRYSFAGLAGVWLLNLLDAYVFFPDRRESFTVKGFSLQPQASPQGFGLAVTKSF